MELRQCFSHYLTITVVNGKGDSEAVVASCFYAHDDDAAAVIARATTRKWVAASKDNGSKAITRDMVKLHRMPAKA